MTCSVGRCCNERGVDGGALAQPADGEVGFLKADDTIVLQAFRAGVVGRTCRVVRFVLCGFKGLQGDLLFFI